MLGLQALEIAFQVALGDSSEKAEDSVRLYTGMQQKRQAVWTS